MRTRTRRPLVLVVAAAAGVLALAGCGGGSAGAGASGSGTAAGAASSAAAAGASSSGTATAEVAASRTVTSMTSFTSPTENIGCYLAPVEGAPPYARCDLKQATWTEPEPAGGCSGDWGGAGGFGSVGVGGGPAQVLCITDSVVDPSAPVLAYGSSITLGPLTCTSQTTGMECDNAETGHGFTVSRAKHDLR